MYLIIGDDIACIDKEVMHREHAHLVDYYRVGGSCVIKGKKRYFCSCGYEVCWHIIKTVLETDGAGPKEE